MTELDRHALRCPLQALVAGLRLLVLPGLLLVLLRTLPFPEDARNVLCVVAVMPSAIGTVLLSDLYGADSRFAASSVLLTHVCSLVTIPLWLWLIGLG